MNAKKFEWFLSRPGMFIAPINFDSIVAFTNGFMTADESEFLGNLHEWLFQKLGYANSLTWDGLIIILAFGNVAISRYSLTQEQAAFLTEFTIDTLGEYVNCRLAEHS